MRKQLSSYTTRGPKNQGVKGASRLGALEIGEVEQWSEAKDCHLQIVHCSNF